MYMFYVFYSDLIAAYKGVLNEKEALEKSLQILSSGNKTSRRSSTDSATKETSNDDSAQEEVDEDDSSELQQLRDQLSTLTSSMATLTSEKSKMEANYQAEKKALRVNNTCMHVALCAGSDTLESFKP